MPIGAVGLRKVGPLPVAESSRRVSGTAFVESVTGHLAAATPFGVQITVIQEQDYDLDDGYFATGKAAE
jgi:hypothetical protein